MEDDEERVSELEGISEELPRRRQSHEEKTLRKYLFHAG